MSILSAGHLVNPSAIQWQLVGNKSVFCLQPTPQWDFQPSVDGASSSSQLIQAVGTKCVKCQSHMDVIVDSMSCCELSGTMGKVRSDAVCHNTARYPVSSDDQRESAAAARVQRVHIAGMSTSVPCISSLSNPVSHPD
jgi:hypothetical protein